MKTKSIFLISIIFFLAFCVQVVRADAVIENGINFLKAKQDASGKLTGGFSSPSQWGSIAFVANGINPKDVKISPDSASLKDFLLTDKPDNGAATDWESRILAIVAMGEDPTNFGDTNFVQNLENFYNNNQIGDLTSLNDDIFGLLALIASGNYANSQTKEDALNFIVSHQANDGGFSWSPDTTCQYCGQTPSMTAAAVQALQEAKDNNLTNPNLEEALDKAKSYLISHQNSDGGFGDYGSSDADTTSWVLMAFNVLGIKDSTPSANARNWLVSNQQPDGGFLGWSGTDTTTTAQALIALVGKGWVLQIFTSSANSSPISSPTPTPTQSASPSPTPNPTSTAPTSTPSPTPTPGPTSSPASTPTPTPSPSLVPLTTTNPTSIVLTQISSPSPSPEVLGEATHGGKVTGTSADFKKIAAFLLGVSIITFSVFKLWRGRS